MKKYLGFLDGDGFAVGLENIIMRKTKKEGRKLMTKISKIVKQTKEYERLGRLIENIEKALKDFDKINKVEGNVIYNDGTLTFNGGTILGSAMDNLPSQPIKKRVDVFLSDAVSELIREDMKTVLKKHLAKLKKQRNALEV